MAGATSDETDPEASTRVYTARQSRQMGGKLEERPLNCGQKGTKHVTQTLGSLGSKVAVPHGGPICGYGGAMGP